MKTENIKNPFPYPMLEPIIGQPNYKTLTRLATQLNANATSVQANVYPMELLGLTVSQKTYQALTGVHWVLPGDLGRILVIQDRATSAQIAAVTNVHKQTLQTYETTLQCDKILKTPLLEAVEPGYYRVLKNRHIQFANMSTIQLLQHLK